MQFEPHVLFYLIYLYSPPGPFVPRRTLNSLSRSSLPSWKRDYIHDLTQFLLSVSLVNRSWSPPAPMLPFPSRPVTNRSQGTFTTLRNVTVYCHAERILRDRRDRPAQHWTRNNFASLSSVPLLYPCNFLVSTSKFP
jgi:hypothetical protein